MNWWGSRENPSDRLKVEIVAMKKAFILHGIKTYNTSVSWDRPFKVRTLGLDLVTTNPAEPYWLITFMMEEISPASTIHWPTPIKLKITYKPGFPEKEPWPTLPGFKIGNAYHHYMEKDNGNYVICLHGHDGERSKEWDPARSTAATLAVWSVQWVRAWIVWNKTGTWPAIS